MMTAHMRNFGTSGRPDLLLLRGQELLFVEVKGKSDILHKNQALWFRNFYRPFGLPLQVLHLGD